MRHSLQQIGKLVRRESVSYNPANPSDRNASGEDDSEFDFRVFRWHRLEHTGRVPHAARHPWAPEAVLDLEADPMSGDNSRRASPRPDKLDASAVSTINPLSTTTGTADQTADQTDFLLSLSQLNEGGMPFTVDPLDTLGFMDSTDEPWLMGNTTTTTTRQMQESSTTTRMVEDDFSRFMEQAGYASGSTADILSWLPT
jgi:hypothetical protein